MILLRHPKIDNPQGQRKRDDMSTLYDSNLRAMEVLGTLLGRRVYFEPLGGNNGDILLEHASRRALSDAGVEATEDEVGADVIVINGGGGMKDGCRQVLAALRRHARAQPERELIILPSSFWMREFDLAALLRPRRAPTTIFARERVSLDFLQKLDLPDTCRLGLDCDMALTLRGSEFITSLKSRGGHRHVLIAERSDIESPAGARLKPIGSRALNRWIPRTVKTSLKRLINRRRERRWATGNPTVQRIRTYVDHHVPGVVSLPTLASDVSDTGIADFEGFCQAIADAAAVATNRLHVALLASMLDKPTFMLDNTYFKLRAVYEYALQDHPHVQYVTSKCLQDGGDETTSGELANKEDRVVE